MTFSTLFYLALLLFSGLFFGRAVKFIKLPNVTGYLIGGLLIGPYCLGILPMEMMEDLNLVSEAALGFIAFVIGGEFKFSYLKKVGITPIIIALLEAATASICVFITLVIFGFGFSLALLLGAIAAATAPAATIMVVNQYKAKGPVTDTLLSVVAIDDAVALILYGFASAIVSTITNPSETSVLMLLLKPLIEIIGSLLIGIILAVAFAWLLKFFKKGSNRLVLSCAFVFLGAGIATTLGLSGLLLCMGMGAALVNISASTPEIMKQVDGFTPPLFVMFFVISGAELNIGILPQIGVIGVIYVIARIFGKISGAYLGAVIGKADSTVKKYIGFTLMPQAGVAIGLSLIAAQQLPQYGDTIRAVVLCATLIYELTGPAITKIALTKAGEIKTYE